jgi:hypothetical protein
MSDFLMGTAMKGLLERPNYKPIIREETPNFPKELHRSRHNTDCLSRQRHMMKLIHIEERDRRITTNRLGKRTKAGMNDKTSTRRPKDTATT